MRQKWLLVLLVLSLGANAVALGFYFRKTRQSARQWESDVRTGARYAARSHRLLTGAFLDEQLRLRRARVAARAELARNICADEVESTQLAAAVDSLARLSRANWELQFRFVQEALRSGDSLTRERVRRQWHTVTNCPDSL